MQRPGAICLLLRFLLPPSNFAVKHRGLAPTPTLLLTSLTLLFFTRGTQRQQHPVHIRGRPGRPARETAHACPHQGWHPPLTFLPSWKGTTGSSSACRMSREQEMCFTLREDTGLDQDPRERTGSLGPPGAGT